ncbi:MAG: hypothetical protein V3V00_12610 [Saprospiraceae bacterium]
MTSKVVALLCTILSIITLNAQETGIVNYKQLGLSFEIPSGWVGQETEGV